jgi:hypothetical protein
VDSDIKVSINLTTYQKEASEVKRRLMYDEKLTVGLANTLVDIPGEKSIVDITTSKLLSSTRDDNKSFKSL